ncbi:glycosyl hydrolase family 95 catalytic domain-containing protein [Streptomyces coffeae]|uniref:Glycoside hydrolase N-terminal domain-containing protein n=1 Tax=Streptomyces coffeae TaxID=621382 RepID=A0ABS1NGV3_9ACTN|nr:glycoside hydrolase N-terminal domain-containing protein [Streptomyces coffeae]MBL1099278.1 glycoside hydrolase N-terminal domain-containing protein [Streptomyces coffeae]
MSEQPRHRDEHRTTSRRTFLGLSTGVGAGLALGGLPVFRAMASPSRPSAPSLVAADEATTLWYPKPGTEAHIIQEGLAVGNGRFGALVTGDPAKDVLFLTDATLWTGGLNDTLDSGGQFPYESEKFGTLSLLAKAYVSVPAHTSTAISGYRRQLDLSNGYVSASYQHSGATYTREVYASHPDDVVVVRLKQSGGGSYTGSVALNGTHGESTGSDSAPGSASFGGTLGNGLVYGAVVTATGTGGKVSVDGGQVRFDGCSEVLIVIAGGTNYVPDPSKGYQDPAVDPKSVAREKATAAAKESGDALLATHVEDYRKLYGAMTVDLGTSTEEQRGKDTAGRLAARAADGAAPDPELEAAYLQFARYLTISSSRGSVPSNLQGLWLDRNDPDWMADYHTDINVQMNYWFPDRAGLGACFEPLADYLLAQVPVWTRTTQALFNDTRNRFRNSSGKVAGWTTAISHNISGGLGWYWHPAGNAWLCNSVFEHYEFTQDTEYLSKIYPLLKGACQFWEARLITTTVTDPDGGTREVLIDDKDWSPEHGPEDAKGITYAQELVWQLFQNYRVAAQELGVDPRYASTIAGLQRRLHLPVVSPKTGWLEEWMSPDNLGETTHRHLSPLVGLFPGDRLTSQDMPGDIADGVTKLLTARGMNSFGWGMAWRALCWARLKDAARAYQGFLTPLRPSKDNSNGTAINFFDMYALGDRATFQIDANFGVPTAALEMLLYSRPGLIELLPALPSAWAARGNVTGIGARGGFTIDLAWADGQVTSATVHSARGGRTTVAYGKWTRKVTLAAGESTTLTPPPRAAQ